MPSLDQLTASQVVKLLLIGDSGTGKTGSVASLVKAGYNVRVLDFDNGWESLAAAVKRTCPERISSVVVECFRDTYKSTQAGPVISGMPKAFTGGLKLLDGWGDLGHPGSWGPECVLVVDSLTFLSDAAYSWADALNPSAKDKRQIYGAAQEAIEHVLALLTGPSFNTNVIVTAHIRYIDLPDGTKRGYPTAVGQALSPTIPRYFNSVAACQTEIGGKRTIQTLSTALIDLKNPKSFEMQKSLPIETGLATFFEVLRGKPTWTPPQIESLNPLQSLTSIPSSISTTSLSQSQMKEAAQAQNLQKPLTSLKSISLKK